MRLHQPDHEQVALIALLCAWAGMWGAWVPSVAASLSQNIFYLAEWSTFLPGVRSGALRLAPDSLRLAAAAGVIALLFCLQAVRAAPVRWIVRLVAAAPVLFVLLPPYPDVFQLWWSPSYGARFGMVTLLGLGLLASVWSGRVSVGTNRLLVIAACILASAAGLAGLFALMPAFEADYASPLGLGWGSLLFFLGLLLATVAYILPERVFNIPGRKQNGSVA
jgi:hypothetical protein